MNKPKPEAESQGAIVLLTHDHREVALAFKEFERLGQEAVSERKKLSEKICQDLMKHMIAEEKIFYPAIKNAVKDGALLINESLAEHGAAKELIDDIRDMSGDEELFFSKVHVLSEQIAHHIAHEEEQVFPAVEKTELDLMELGRQIADCKQALGSDV